MAQVGLKIWVIGGAGYVGSAVSMRLRDEGHEVWVLDDLSTGHRSFVPNDEKEDRFVLGRAGDQDLVREFLSRPEHQQKKFDCVMHFAACALVAESVTNPEKYYDNNVRQTERLIQVLLEKGIQNFIFSSTCAIYGDPQGQAIHENLPKSPMNPYGASKLEAESVLERYAKEKGLRAICFRYFNAAGAEPGLRVGEWHSEETHLIPNVLRAALEGREVSIYGSDYPTSDGTCIRDYVHVTDLAGAHIAGMKRVLSTSASVGSFEAYNLGSEKGYSVLEVVQACEAVVGKKVKTVSRERRPGDPAKLVADATLAKQTFQWNTRPLEAIVSSAWQWEQKKSQILRPAIFLDRDGTLNEDPGYLSHPQQMTLLPSVPEALALLRSQGYLLVVVSNQSGVGRGLIARDALPQIHAKLEELLRPAAVTIDHYALCLHTPDDQCECRKPKPKLIIDAAMALGIDLSSSYMIGDKQSDLDAGRAAGCKGSLLVLTGDGKRTQNEGIPGQADYIGESLIDLARWIIQ